MVVNVLKSACKPTHYSIEFGKDDAAHHLSDCEFTANQENEVFFEPTIGDDWRSETCLGFTMPGERERKRFSFC
jgi:hypothetical protein